MSTTEQIVATRLRTRETESKKRKRKWDAAETKRATREERSKDSEKWFSGLKQFELLRCLRLEGVGSDADLAYADYCAEQGLPRRGRSPRIPTADSNAKAAASSSVVQRAEGASNKRARRRPPRGPDHGVEADTVSGDDDGAREPSQAARRKSRRSHAQIRGQDSAEAVPSRPSTKENEKAEKSRAGRRKRKIEASATADEMGRDAAARAARDAAAKVAERDALAVELAQERRFDRGQAMTKAQMSSALQCMWAGRLHDLHAAYEAAHGEARAQVEGVGNARATERGLVLDLTQRWLRPGVLVDYVNPRDGAADSLRVVRWEGARVHARTIGAADPYAAYEPPARFTSEPAAAPPGGPPLTTAERAQRFIAAAIAAAHAAPSYAARAAQTLAARAASAADEKQERPFALQVDGLWRAPEHKASGIQPRHRHALALWRFVCTEALQQVAPDQLLRATAWNSHGSPEFKPSGPLLALQVVECRVPRRHDREAIARDFSGMSTASARVMERMVELALPVLSAWVVADEHHSRTLRSFVFDPRNEYRLPCATSLGVWVSPDPFSSYTQCLVLDNQTVFQNEARRAAFVLGFAAKSCSNLRRFLCAHPLYDARVLGRILSFL